jgi:hypothetical protein
MKEPCEMQQLVRTSRRKREMRRLGYNKEICSDWRSVCVCVYVKERERKKEKEIEPRFRSARVDINV